MQRNLLLVLLIGFLFSCNSSENNTLNGLEEMNPEESIDKIYDVLLNRKADPPGKSKWLELLDSGTTMREITKFVALSEEYYDKKIKGKKPEKYVDTIYKDITGKAASTEELRSAVDRINENRLDWKKLIEEL